MTMTDVSQQEGATAAEGQETSGRAADHSTPLTMEALREYLPGLIDQSVSQHVSAHSVAMYQGLQGLLDKKVGEIRDQFGISREDAVALKEAARQQLGDEGFALVTDKAERDRLERENKALREKPAEVKQEAKADAWDTSWKTEHLPECQDYIEERLGKYDDATMIAARKRMKSDQLTTYATTRDPRGIVGWKREFKKQVDVMEAEQSDTAEKERTTLDTTRSGGGGGSEWDTYQKALKEGGKLPSPEEIDRLTAAHFR